MNTSLWPLVQSVLCTDHCRGYYPSARRHVPLEPLLHGQDTHLETSMAISPVQMTAAVCLTPVWISESTPWSVDQDLPWTCLWLGHPTRPTSTQQMWTSRVRPCIDTCQHLSTRMQGLLFPVGPWFSALAPGNMCRTESADSLSYTAQAAPIIIVTSTNSHSLRH